MLKKFSYSFVWSSFVLDTFFKGLVLNMLQSPVHRYMVLVWSFPFQWTWELQFRDHLLKLIFWSPIKNFISTTTSYNLPIQLVSPACLGEKQVLWKVCSDQKKAKWVSFETRHAEHPVPCPMASPLLNTWEACSLPFP